MHVKIRIGFFLATAIVLLFVHVTTKVHDETFSIGPTSAWKSQKRNEERWDDATVGLFYNANMSEELRNAFNGTPFRPLPEFKNPCWMSRLEKDRRHTNGLLEYRGKPKLWDKLESHTNSKLDAGQNCRLRCFPYFMLIGVNKAGSSDLFARIAQHPNIHTSPWKETWYWSRYRLLSKASDLPFGEYVDLFDLAADEILNSTQDNTPYTYHPDIIMEGTPHNLYDYWDWHRIPGNANLTEPKYILPHTLYALMPSMKFIVILRNPVDRLYSVFNYMTRDRSPEIFDDLVREMLDAWKECRQIDSERACAYKVVHDRELRTSKTLRAGLYYIHLTDWFQVFPRSQFCILHFDSYYTNTEQSLRKIFTFLDVIELSSSEIEPLVNRKIKNAGPEQLSMLPETRKMLEDFYKPYDVKLAKLLNDDMYLWP